MTTETKSVESEPRPASTQHPGHDLTPTEFFKNLFKTANLIALFQTINPYLQSLGLVIAVTLLGLLTDPFLGLANLVMFYLLAEVIAAIRFGLGPSILAALLSVTAFNYVFVPPRYSFGFEDIEYILSFTGLLVIGLVISTLTARVREQVKAAEYREMQTAASYEFSRALAAAAGQEEIVQVVVTHIGRVFEREAIILLPLEGGGLSPRAIAANKVLDEHEYAVANWVFKNNQAAGAETSVLAAAQLRYHPLVTAEGLVGVLGLKTPDMSTEPLGQKQEQLLESFASQAAMALERVQLAHQAHQTQLLQETDKLQAALLNSISHNLRTPLSSITGLLSSLRAPATHFDETIRTDLIENAWEEADRMNRLVANLLDMTRLQADALHITREPGDVQDLIGVALTELANKLQDRPVEVTLPAELPLVPMDFVLMSHVLINLLDNAHKYSPPDKAIEICAAEIEGQIQLSVVDQGPGIPQGEQGRVFEKFYRLRQVDGIGGTGLGLSICKGIVEVHGGQIWVETPPRGGTAIRLTLPLDAPSATPATMEGQS